MNDDSLSELDPINVMAEEFLTRHRRGDSPDVSEYLTRYPDLAERIRALFPALLLMEKFAAPTPETTAITEPAVLQQLGEYRLVREVGRGGMGIVYEAVQESLSRRVAVKVLAPNLRHGKFLERFRREAKSAARLHHTNIVPVFGVGEHDGQPYYAMQFIDGRGLDAVLADRKTPPDSSAPTIAAPVFPAVPSASFVPNPDSFSRDPKGSASSAPLRVAAKRQFDAAHFRCAAQLALQAADALAYAHAQGVLHRDIKPANLLLDTQGTLWIVDFGLAKADDADNLTEQGGVVGTLRYLAPERFQGQCDARADVYALGVTLYEMLTLRPAFDAVDRASLLEQIARRTATPPRQLVAALPLDLETIVLKAMAKEANERYAGARELADDLRCYLEDRPIRARRPTLPQRLAKWSRRHKPAVWSVAVSTVALLVMVIVSLAWSNFLISQEKDQKTEALKDKEAALVTAKQHELTARRRFYASQIYMAHQAWELGNPARVLELLEGLRPRAEESDLRSFEWYYLWRLCRQGQRLSLKVAGARTERFALSPDGKTLAAICGNGAIQLCDVATGQLGATWKEDDRPALCLTFAPDGKALFVVAADTSRQVKRFDVKTGGVQVILDAVRGGTVRRLALSPDGKTLATGHEDGAIKLWDAATWQELAALKGEPNQMTCLAFSPDGRKLAAAIPWGDDNGSVKIWDCKSRSLCATCKLYEPYCFAFSPDGSRLAVGGEFGRIALFETATGRQGTSCQGHAGTVFTVAFAADGKTLASGGNDRTVRLWEAETGKQRACFADLGPVLSVGLTPDGQVLASAGNYETINIRDTALSPQELVLPGAGAFVAFSPDGKTLASAGPKALKLWDVAAWKARMFPFPKGTDPAEAVAFSHDGKMVAVARGRSLKVLEAASLQQQTGFDGEHVVWSVAFSPDDRTLASASYFQQGVQLWDLAGWQVRATLTPHPLGSARTCAFSPDGTTLAVGSQFGVLKLFDLASNRERAVLQDCQPDSMDWIFCVAFSPNGKLLASGNRRGIVKLWDGDTGQLRKTIQAHTGTILALAFTSDGDTLAGSRDRVVTLWDVATGQERMTVKGFHSAVRSLAFAANDALLAAGSEDGTVRIWKAAADAEARALREDVVAGK